MFNKIAISALTISLAFSGQLFAKGPKAPTQASIADIVVAAATVEEGKEFTVLLSLLQETGLDSVLAGKGQYTVFAPTDEAFQPVLDLLETLEVELTAAQKVNVLLYHVTDGRRWSNSVVNRNDPKAIEMLSGGYIMSMLDASDPEYVMAKLVDTNDINDGWGSAVIVEPDLNASNGVIHVIDRVLIPENLLD